MKLRKTGYIVWDKVEQQIVITKGMFVYATRSQAWLVAKKERKHFGYSVHKINLSLPPSNEIK